jgi:homoserine kinase
MQQVTVRVPASTSNLGPGFDCLGVALRLYNRVTVARSRDDLLPPLARQAGALFFRTSKVRPFYFTCRLTDQVPRARGLGSSATVRAGLLLGLNELAGRPLEQSAVFKICAQLEKHPDNAAPAVFGGFTVVRAERVEHFAVSARLRFVLLIPELEISTPAARAILPKTVDRSTAVETCGNACAITAAFVSKRYEALQGAFRDHLHQPFRRKLIPFLPRVIAAAEKAGALGAFLSGSGSTICAITLDSPVKVGAAMRAAIKSKKARIVITRADNDGARFLKIRNPKSEIRNS